jgi:tetratricopeptide (TPR) repeat protein
VLVLYASAGRNDFVDFDDYVYVVLNPRVNGGLSAEGVAWAFTTTRSLNWHPLTWLSHMLDAELFGLDPRGHHWTSIALHAANAGFLLWVLWRTSGALGPSAFAAGLFALHPLRVESVAWIAERKDVLFGLFWMLTWLAYLRWVERPSAPRYGLALALFALGLLSKPMIVTLPFVLLLLDYWPLRRPLSPRLLGEKLPFLALALLASAATAWIQGSGVQYEIPLGLRLSNALVAYVTYLQKTLWPLDLAAFYPFPDAIPLWKSGGAALILGAISALALHAARSLPYLAVGWLWFLGTLVPVIGLIPVGFQSLADRYTYVPSIGLSIMAAWGAAAAAAGLQRRSGRERTAAVGVAAAAVLLACGLLTRDQIGHWRNTVAVFERVVAVTEPSAFAHTELGRALQSAGDVDEALAQYGRALEIDPDYARARASLGEALLAEGRPRDALPELRRALELRPGAHKLRFQIGLALEPLGYEREALAHYRAELELNPAHLGALQRSALILALSEDPRLRDPAQSIAQAARAAELTRYADAATLDVLAVAHASAGDVPAAIHHATRAAGLASSRGDAALEAQIRERLDHYRSLAGAH